MATRPGILGALAASVTDFQPVTCIMGFLRVKHWDGGGWVKLVRWDVNSGAHGVTRPTAQGLACGRDVSAVEALGKLGCLDGNSVMRKPSAKPRHKVPAPQANGVAARLRPPPEARA